MRPALPIAAALPVLLLATVSWLQGGEAIKPHGGIWGVVRNAAGVPQMGATVILYNRSERVLRRTITDQNGEFRFVSLRPDVYSIRVALASFLPALKRNILVQPGMQSLLNISLASVFSSIEVVGWVPGQSGLMSEEWKWVLRGSSATRPVLRLLPAISPASTRKSAFFTRTRGMVKLSGGDDAQISAHGIEPDLGTSFALATTLLGANQLQFSGNLAYSPETGLPAAAFRTSFRRELAGTLGPQVGLTMRQLYLPVRAAAGQAWLAGREGGAPALRTVSATLYDRNQLADGLVLEYGASLDSITFLDRLNYLSPFARLSYASAEGVSLQVAYASGSPPPELLYSPDGLRPEFEQDLAALAMFPRVSLAGGRVRVQRVATYEVGYQLRSGSRTYSAGAYWENVSNAGVTLAGAEGAAAATEWLPDLLSRGWVANAGTHRRSGYMAAVTQNLGEHLNLTLAYGGGRVLTTGQAASDRGGPEELRWALDSRPRHAVTVRMAGTAPRSGTQFVTSYQWASLHSVLPPHMYLTQRIREGLGMNISLRQPIPSFGSLPGRLEASAELRNLLAQGYVPVNLNGRRWYLVHTPRSVRGSLSFIF